jgi:hypothetical protein
LAAKERAIKLIMDSPYPDIRFNDNVANDTFTQKDVRLMERRTHFRAVRPPIRRR